MAATLTDLAPKLPCVVLQQSCFSCEGGIRSNYIPLAGLFWPDSVPCGSNQRLGAHQVKDREALKQRVCQHHVVKNHQRGLLRVQAEVGVAETLDMKAREDACN